jgi:hypothetical protein
MDPDWGGASWYGTSSGTYWTLNPKEYADPRKHGPEYQARARRADARRTRRPEPASGTLSAEGRPLDADAEAQPEPPPPTESTAEGPAPSEQTRPTHTATSRWAAGSTTPDAPPNAASDASASARQSADATASPASAPPNPPARTADDASSTDAILDGIRHWLDDRNPGVGARIGRAAIGWAPIALGIGWLAGEVSGCSRFSADCHPAAAPVSWGLQIAVLVVLIAFTRIARITTVATIATLAAIFPASALLLATFDPDSMAAGRTVLGGLMATAWIAGIAIGAVREFRRKPIDRPVS